MQIADKLVLSGKRGATMRKYFFKTAVLAALTAMAMPVMATGVTENTNKETVTGNGTTKDITVNGEFIPMTPAEEVVSVDVKWDDMTFTYKENSKEIWNPQTHQYENASGIGGWSKTQSGITVVNHSNVRMGAELSFESTSEAIGNFSSTHLSVASAAEEAFNNRENAPTETATFTIGGTISETSQLGTITVTLAKESEVNLEGAELSEYEEKIRAAITENTTTLAIKTGSVELTSEMGKKITSALTGTSVTNIVLIDATSMGQQALQTCNQLVSINALKVTSLAESAMQYCESLVNVNMPELTQIMGGYTFRNCDKLENVNMPKLTGIDEYEYYTFDECTSLKNVYMPSLQTMGVRTFMGCSALESINLPELVSMGPYGFAQCKNLKYVNLPKLERIDDTTWEKGSTFAWCESLEEISLPKLDTVYNELFLLDNNLKHVSLPSATSMGQNPFNRCTLIETITFEKVIESVDKEYSFSGFDTKNVVLTLNKDQGDVGEYPTVFGTNGTFCGQTFKEVKKAE